MENKVNSANEDETRASFNSKILDSMFRKLYADNPMQDFYFPFIKNKLKQTPLDLCVDVNKSATEEFIKYLKNQPVLHHSKDVIEILPTLITKRIPYVDEYLDSRLLQTNLLKKHKTMFLKESQTWFQNMIKTTDLWPAHKEFKGQFKEVRFLQKQDNCYEKLWNILTCRKRRQNNEVDIKVEILDLPYIHSYQSEYVNRSESFFKAISNVEGYELFKCKSVQYLINYKWEMTKKFTFYFLFLPFFLFFITFITYSNVFNGQIDLDEKHNRNGFLALSILLYSFCLYFVIMELLQFFHNKLDYLTGSLIWNMLDLIPAFLIIGVVSSNLAQRYADYQEYNFIGTVHAIASVTMWLKFMYFLRLLEATGYLIRIIVNTVYDMKIFIMILFIV